MIKVIIDKDAKPAFTKAMGKIKKLNQLDDFDFKFLQDFLDDYTAYVNNMFIGIVKGLMLKMSIDPNQIKLKAKLNIDDLSLHKSIEQQLKAYIERAKGYIGDLTYEQLTEPMFIDGDFIINPETGLPLTIQDFNNITNNIYEFMNNAIGTLPTEFAVKSVVLGHLMKLMDNEGMTMAQQRKIGMDALIKKYGPLPKTIEEARQRYNLKPNVGTIIQNVEARAGEKLAIPAGDIASQVVKSVKDQITAFYRYNDAHPDDKLSTKQLAGNLLYQSKLVKEKLGDNLDNATFESWTRDWRRVARNETALATTDAYLAEHEDEIIDDVLPHFVYAGHWNNEEKADEICNCFLGEVVALIPSGELDKYLANEDYLKPEYTKYAKRAIWRGKTRETVGWSKANEWIMIISHIGCLHKFIAIKPETQYYNKKFRVVVNKTRDMG